jgi:hypothetical protein
MIQVYCDRCGKRIVGPIKVTKAPLFKVVVQKPNTDFEEEPVDLCPSCLIDLKVFMEMKEKP